MSLDIYVIRPLVFNSENESNINYDTLYMLTEKEAKILNGVCAGSAVKDDELYPDYYNYGLSLGYRDFQYIVYGYEGKVDYHIWDDKLGFTIKSEPIKSVPLIKYDNYKCLIAWDDNYSGTIHDIRDNKRMSKRFYNYDNIHKFIKNIKPLYRQYWSGIQKDQLILMDW